MKLFRDLVLSIKYESLIFIDWIKENTSTEFINEELVPELIVYVYQHTFSSPEKTLNFLSKIFELILNSNVSKEEDKKNIIKCLNV